MASPEGTEKPDGTERQPTPPLWRHVVVHFISQALQVEGPAVEEEIAAEGEAAEGEEIAKSLPPLVEFDPIAVLKKQVAEDVRFVFLSYADLPDASPESFQAKIHELARGEAEKAVERAKQKEEEISKEALENEKAQPDGDGAVSPTAGGKAGGAKAGKALQCIDGVIVLEGFEEVLEEWLHGDVACDFHALLYLSGTTTEEVEVDETLVHKQRVLEDPALIRSVQDWVKHAPWEHWANNVRVETIANIEQCQEEDGVMARVWSSVEEFAQRHQDFTTWTRDAVVRDVDEYTGSCDIKWYKYLLDSVPPPSQDIPMMLYCLVEQVERNLAVIEEETEAQVGWLDRYLSEAMHNAFTEEAQDTAIVSFEDAREEAEKRAPILHALDVSARRHMGKRLLDGVSCVDICKNVSDNLRVPGYPMRLNFPDCITEQERSAQRHRVYPFLQDFSPLEIERALLLKQFYSLLAKLGLRDVNLDARLYHEKITKDYLAQTLSNACHDEPAMTIEYYARHDALLVALSRPVTISGATHRWCSRNVCLPSFNNIQEAVAAHAGVDKTIEMYNLDCGEFGYAQVVEKVVVGMDGTIWTQTQMCRGMTDRQTRHSRIFARGFSAAIREDTRWLSKTQQWAEEVQEEEVTFEEEATDEEKEELTRQAQQKAQDERDAFKNIRRAEIHGEAGGVHYRFSMPPPEELWDSAACDVAANVAITFPTGQIVEGKSNEGQLVVFWPQDLIQRQQSQLTPGLSCAGTSTPYFVPGSDLDTEVERVVLKNGTLIRKLLSGRREMYFPDGTMAHRNPIKEELERALHNLHPDVSEDYHGFLRCLLFVVDAELGADTLTQGAPGHWVVTQLNGQRVGRVESVEEEKPLMATEGEEDGAEGDEPVPPPNAAEEEGDDASKDHAASSPDLETILAPFDVRRIGNVLEYTIPPLAVSVQVDPGTRERCTSMASGLLVIDNPTNTKRTCLINDGTVITLEDARVTVEKPDAMPRVVCEENTLVATMYDKSTLVIRPDSASPLELSAQYVRASCLPRGRVDFCGGMEARPTDTLQADLCRCVVMMKEESRSLLLWADQTVTVTTEESGEQLDATIHPSPMVVEGPVISTGVTPRLFVIYGNGEAEELLTGAFVEECVELAQEEGATVLRDQLVGPPLSGCLAHTIYCPGSSTSRTVPIAQPVVIPPIIRSKDIPPPASTAAFQYVTFRQFIEYPKMHDDRKTKFDDGLKAFDIWEAEHMATHAEIGKKEKKKDDKKGKKDKKDKKGIGAGAAAEPADGPAAPVFTHPQLRLSIREHSVTVLTCRANEEKRRTADEMMQDAVATTSPDARATKIQKITRGRQSRQSVTSIRAQHAADAAAATAGSEEAVSPCARLDSDAGQEVRRPIIITEEALPTFKYFESHEGIQFLVDSGLLEGHKPYVPIPDLTPIEVTNKKIKSGWRPPRVYEEEDYAHYAPLNPEEFVKNPTADTVAHAETSTATPPDSPRVQPDLRTSRPPTPEGPHPDKTHNRFDTIGNLRPPKKPVPKAVVQNNLNFMRVEGPVNRRVRTVSVVHKKNACYAPSVQDVRKSGLHVMQGTVAGLARAKGVIPEPDLPTGPAAWDLSSTQQGLGDPMNLVEVTPGACRFGPLRIGHVYRMVIALKNLDVDATRFNVTLIKDHPQVTITHQPVNLAPGMMAKITVEMVGSAPGLVEALVEVKTKAHIVNIPVLGRILEGRDYDILDAESMTLHGRHIGKLGKSVEVVQDDYYAKKVLEDAYAPPVNANGYYSGGDDVPAMRSPLDS
eukprot:GEMP01001163.1.p1 GENE.GEMP01001163.1~~GEMP01001163.1.p1  ORF type:complete len:1774 (+),score=520.83 GEMP01001163.1:221-5542(+)